MSDHRSLLIRTRTVPADGLASYRTAWDTMVRVARFNDFHAWVFQDSADSHSFVEFIEYGASSEASIRGIIQPATDALENVAHASCEKHCSEWRHQITTD